MSIKHVVGISGGKDSTTALLMCMELCDHADIIPAMADTDNEDEQTLEYALHYLPRMTGLKVKVVKADFTEEFKVKREKLQRIADGELESDVYGKRNFKYRWTADAAKRVLELLHPTGNAYLDLCMVRGGFPSKKRQFCTEYLKVIPMTEFQLSIIDQGHAVWSWQGTRIDESEKRRERLQGTGACVKSFEVVGGGLYINRPNLRMTRADVFEAHRAAGIKPNPLYSQGMTRVGCIPCVNETKPSLRQIGKRFPHHIDRIAEMERIVNSVARPGSPTSFFQMGTQKHAGQTSRVWEIVDWANTTRGGRQRDLLADLEETHACSSADGLCE